VPASSPRPSSNEPPPNTLQTGGCAAPNRRGDPCAAPALKGTELCLARRETLRDKLARKLAEHADEVVAAYLAGIRSDDPNRAYRAADAWISRVHGRPKETVETDAPADSLDIASMTREQRDPLKRELLRQHPELVERIAGLRAVE
jgi:hypothetical protein